MDIIIFYNYLKHQKEVKGSLAKKISKLHTSAIMLLILLMGSCITGIAFSAISSMQAFTWIPLLIEIVITIITYFYSEHIQIKMSYKKLEEYRTYCFELYQWLNTLSIYKVSDILNIKNRIVSRIESKTIEYNQKRERRDKWTQVLLVPIVLAVLSVLIKDQKDFSIVINFTFLVILIGIIVYVIICAIGFLANVPDKRAIEQMKYFVDDLQGVLDIQCPEN